MRRISEELGEGGEVRKREESRYEVFPVEGQWFERLIEKDGRPLTPGEAAREDERQQQFAEKIRKGGEPGKKAQRVSFNQELVDKYVWTLQPPAAADGRDCHVLSFRPKSGDLPVRNRMDYALNNAEGEVWIDSQSFEVARVQFELKGKVKLWWGLIGSISQAEGTVERRPVADGVWLPRRFEMLLNGRIFFSSLHRRQEVHWTDVQPVAAADGSGQE